MSLRASAEGLWKRVYVWRFTERVGAHSTENPPTTRFDSMGVEHPIRWMSESTDGKDVRRCGTRVWLFYISKSNALKHLCMYVPWLLILACGWSAEIAREVEACGERGA